MNFFFRWFVLLALVVVFSCKKDPKANGDANQPSLTGTKEDLLMDSVYLYSKEVYLWQDVIPPYSQFNPRKYKGTTEIGSAQKVMQAIKGLQKLDRFSFVTTKEASDAIQTGVEMDWGFFLRGALVSQNEVGWYVTYVYNESSAGAAGVKRGWRINKINGSLLDGSSATIDFLNNIFFGTVTTASFEFTKPDGTSTGVMNLSKTRFTANAVLHKSIIEDNGKKVGYLVFNQFFGAPARKELGDAFTFFQSGGINELVVDLRYNPGGSVDTQDTLANLIAPTAANKKMMYKYLFNKGLESGNFPLLSKKPGFEGTSFAENNNTVVFNKAGSLNLNRVFVIVTGSSASASEILINNLKPYMDVKLIGDTSYGKPVGFFPIQIYDYAIYPISFKTVNSAGNADYYSGFVPDKLTVDFVDKDWGDTSDPSLAAALKYIGTGAFRLRPESAEELKMERLFKEQQEMLQPVYRQWMEKKFSGMYKESK